MNDSLPDKPRRRVCSVWPWSNSDDGQGDRQTSLNAVPAVHIGFTRAVGQFRLPDGLVLAGCFQLLDHQKCRVIARYQTLESSDQRLANKRAPFFVAVLAHQPISVFY